MIDGVGDGCVGADIAEPETLDAKGVHLVIGTPINWLRAVTGSTIGAGREGADNAPRGTRFPARSALGQ